MEKCHCTLKKINQKKPKNKLKLQCSDNTAEQIARPSFILPSNPQENKQFKLILGFQFLTFTDTKLHIHGSEVVSMHVVASLQLLGYILTEVNEFYRYDSKYVQIFLDIPLFPHNFWAQI